MVTMIHQTGHITMPTGIKICALGGASAIENPPAPIRAAKRRAASSCACGTVPIQHSEGHRLGRLPHSMLRNPGGKVSKFQQEKNWACGYWQIPKVQSQYNSIGSQSSKPLAWPQLTGLFAVCFQGHKEKPATRWLIYEVVTSEVFTRAACSGNLPLLSA
jgi:hypothetical protein